MWRIPANVAARLSPYWGETGYGEVANLDLAYLLKIVREWRWLIVGAIGLGLAGAIIATLLTTPVYRAWVTLEVNPPSVEILDEKSREAAVTPALFEFVATQVGLLSSRTLAERVAQDLNLGANQEFVGSEGDAATRLQIATAKVASNLDVDRARRRAADQSSATLPNHRSSRPTSPMASPKISSAPGFSADLKRRPTLEHSSSNRSPKRGATSSGRSGRWSPMLRPRASSIPARTERARRPTHPRSRVNRSSR